MKIESHLENLKESVREIERIIQSDLTGNQRSLGFHASAAAVDMMEIILHQENLIDWGFIVKHEWFNSPNKIREKFPFDFPRKKEMIFLASRIEGVRNNFCYGKRQEEILLESLVSDFNKLKEIFMEVTRHEL
ncbi:MAG TPA: hypothetical protein VJG31_03110 [Candidatus Nanoarchaeia archaeon]|nr:hypothetical protein [Candidatus Nanoarchaeia archaeon]